MFLFQSINFTILIGSMVLVILLMCSALISGAEVALFSLTPSDLNDDDQKDTKLLNIISKLLSQPKKLLATILVANNFINIGIVLLFAKLSNSIFGDLKTSITLGFFFNRSRFSLLRLLSLHFSFCYLAKFYQKYMPTEITYDFQNLWQDPFSF